MEVFRHYNFPEEIKARKDWKKVVLLQDYWFPNYTCDNYCFEQNLSWADLIIMSSAEIVNDDLKLVDWAKATFKNKNIIFLFNGVNKQKELFNSDIFFYPNLYFFHAVVQFNKAYAYNVFQKKPRKYLFDALLGTNKHQRLLVWDLINRNKLVNYGLISLNQSPFSDETKITYQSPELDKFDHPTYVKFREKTKDDPKANYSANDFGLSIPNLHKHHYHSASVSFLVPDKIYDNTWYSIISETHEDTIFFTEKTAKAFFAKRIFVFFGAQHSLKRLKEFGFKTFDNIVDERYDNEPDYYVRFNKAMREIVKLNKLSQNEHYTNYINSRDILNHNYNLLVNGNLQLQQMQDFIQMHINRIK